MILFRHQHNPQIDYRMHTMSFTFNNQSISLSRNASLEMFPLILHTQAKHAFRKQEKAYMIYVTEVEEKESTLSPQHKKFLASFNDCFVDNYPPHLPPSVVI